MMLVKSLKLFDSQLNDTKFHFKIIYSYNLFIDKKYLELIRKV